VELPVFALHTVLFPGLPMALRIFEPRYRRLLEDLGPDGTFVVAAIAHGQEVAGQADVYRVGVTVATAAPEELSDGTIGLDIVGKERVALVEALALEPYPVWRTEPYPDEGGAGTDQLEAASEAFGRYLRAIGEDAVPALPHDPVVASFALAAAAPGLLPVRQRLLEAPGAGARLEQVRALYHDEARLVRALGAGAAGPDPAVNPN
jgi:Lon protease-like protein